MKMLPLFGLLALGLNATSNAGDISLGTPLLSGEVTTFVNRQETGRTVLSSAQLQALAGWLEQHRSDSAWNGMITEASPLEDIQLEIELKHSNGAISFMCVIDQANDGRYLRINGPSKVAYKSFGGFFKSWAAARPLSDQELATVEKLVGLHWP